MTTSGSPQNNPPHAGQQSSPQMLGLSMDQLAGLSIDELTGNKVAITMVMHYYKQLYDENVGLKNERNTLSTYVAGYRQKKSDSRTGAILMAMSNVFLGFAINFLTAEPSNNRIGGGLLLCGLLMLGAGLYLSLRDEDQ